jgi:ComF family protein
LSFSALSAGLHALGRTALDVLSPPVCAACEAGLDQTRPGDPFCARCELGVTPRDPQGCAACDRPASGDGLCHRCHVRLSPLDSLTVSFDYDGPIAQAVQRLKYQSRDDLAAPLVQRWLRELSSERLGLEAHPYLLCPVPLHPKRLAARGFDQAWLLALALARTLGFDSAPRALRRDRATPPQVGLGLAAREANVRGAFRASTAVAGRHVLLVDDVLTTGATLRACAEAAMAAGASSVSALTFARAAP